MGEGEDKDDDADTEALLLRASAKQLFETLMEQTEDRIYIKDRHSRFVATSRPLAEMHGFTSRDALLGLTDFDLFSGEHARQAYEDEQEILRTRRPMINKVEKETWPDGSVTWVNSTKAPLYLKSGTLAGIIGISRDITGETLARQQLAEREARLREQNEILRSDYESAEKVQKVMIPGRIPHVKNVDIAYVWRPMAPVGGDIVSFPKNPTDCLLFFMGDVCGHGVTAAFYTVLLKYLASHTAEHYRDNPAEFLDTMNTEITGLIREGFITGLAGHFGRRHRDGGRKLFLSNAGHRHVLVLRGETGETETVTLPVATVMGLPGARASAPTEIDLRPGDRFYAFTDGITEAQSPDGGDFGNEGLAAILRRHADSPLQDSLDTAIRAVAEFTGKPEPHDDITMLAFAVR